MIPQTRLCLSITAVAASLAILLMPAPPVQAEHISEQCAADPIDEETGECSQACETYCFNSAWGYASDQCGDPGDVADWDGDAECSTMPGGQSVYQCDMTYECIPEM